MTPEQLEADCKKFAAYLEANGVPILALLIYTDDRCIGLGSRDMVDELALRTLVDRLGLKLVPK